MIGLVALSLLVAVSCASPSGRYGYVQPVAVVQEHHKVIPGGQSSQYHSQGAYGDYAYGYSDPNSRKHEVGDYGRVKGSYSYIAPDGTPIVNEYYADENGFRSNLAPTAPYDVYPQPEYTPVVSHHAVAHAAPVATHHATHTVAHAAPVAAHHSTHTVAHHAAPVAHHAVAHTAVAHAAPVAHHSTHTVAHAAPAVNYGVSYAAAPAIQRHVSYVSHPPVYARYAPTHTAYPVYGLY